MMPIRALDRLVVCAQLGVLTVSVNLFMLSPLPCYAANEKHQTTTVVESIRREATLPNNGPSGRPLPLVAHWNTGEAPDGFSPAYQMQLIEEGHHILPWFSLPPPNTRSAFYLTPFKRAAELGLPISFISTQWERLLSDDPRYFKLPADQNPNVVTADGRILSKVSPFGPIDPWQKVGKEWTNRQLVKRLQEIYPDPPLVLFISNNEHRKLRWYEVEHSLRYRRAYKEPNPDDIKRKLVADGWATRYRALLEGMRAGLVTAAWRSRSLMIGYGAIGPAFLGRWFGWIKHSLYSPGRKPSVVWDGASAPYYVHNWNGSTDYTVWSPQIESMNWVFMLRNTYQVNPKFWFELSTWDGQSGTANDKPDLYRKSGQQYGPERYGGDVKFGMWLLRPRVVREFRSSRDTRTSKEPYFMAIVRAVDEIHNNSTLKKFWRHGNLVPNLSAKHPYQTDIPPEYTHEKRWFLLTTNLDPPNPWKVNTSIPVFSLALVLGEKPNRQWLIYATSPTSSYPKVTVHVPDYGPTTIDTEPGGSYYLLREENGEIRKEN